MTLKDLLLKNRKTIGVANRKIIGRHLPFLLFISGLAYVISTQQVAAQPSNPNSLSLIGSERANVSGSAQSIQAQAGNVSNVNIQATTITTAWQGYYGNITGQITLEDANGNVFYNWSGLGSLSGEVYASRQSGVDWTTINCTNETENTNEDAFLDKTDSNPDSLGGTFSTNNHPSFLVGTTNISVNTCNSTNAYIDTGSSSSDFYQVLMADGDGDIVYTTLIDENQVGFNGGTYDFELLVGENGNATEASTSTTYFFYIELS